MTKAAIAVAALVLLIGGCGDSGSKPDEIVLLTHDSFFIPDDVLAAFTEETGIAVSVLQGGDAGTMVNQAILTKDNPIADVLFGVDNTFLSRALAEEIFEPYESDRAEDVPQALRLDPAVTPIDFGDVCLNYDIAGLAAAGLDVPGDLRTLTAEPYRGTLVVENPATSSPGLAFLLATIAAFPEDSPYPWQQFWADLRANDVLVAEGWEQAYYGDFSGGSETGDRPLVVSYASSPPAAIIFSEGTVTEPTTGVIEAGCFRQIEFAGVLAGSDAPEAGRRFVDYMLGDAFQEAVPLSMFVFPARADVPIPAVFLDNTTIPESPLAIPAAVIEANREAWIDEWTAIVAR